MKVCGKFFVGILAVAAMAGCNKHIENLDSPRFAEDGEEVYMSMNLQLPAGMPGTRTSTTDKMEEEPGRPAENTIQTVLIVLAEHGTDNYIAHKLTGRVEVDASGVRVKVNSPISKTDLERYYVNNGIVAGEDIRLNDGKEKIRVYVYCNPPQDLLKAFSNIGVVTAGKESLFDNQWLHFACEIGQEISGNKTTEKEEGAIDGTNQSVWASNSFLMSSTSIYEALIPKTYVEWDEFATADHPFIIKKEGESTASAIPVERAVARFDFKDGSPNGGNTYDITTTGAAHGKLQVKLVRMSLVNMSKNFYYLKHVTGGENGGVNYNDPVVVCQPETPINWVVDTDWEMDHKKKNSDDFPLDITGLDKYYNFRLFDVTSDGKAYINETTRSHWNNYRIESVLKQQNDANETSGYHIWRYVTENTIPNRNHQKNGISTGIVFKGKLLAEKAGENAVNKDLLDAINGEYTIRKDPETKKPIGYVAELDAYDDKGELIRDEHGNVKKLTYPILYQFNDVLYVGWNNQIKPLLKDPANQGTLLYDAAMKASYDGNSPDHYYQELVKANNEGGDVETALNNFRKAATAAGFTLYQASNDVTQGDDKGFGSGYYFYYYYWNRHNDNNRVSMGNMEFGVVRNNIYKLSVKSIRNLGHPRISDNDPEKPTPETPDEDAKVYLEVAVEVRPWTVRENEIHF